MSFPTEQMTLLKTEGRFAIVGDLLESRVRFEAGGAKSDDETKNVNKTDQVSLFLLLYRVVIGKFARIARDHVSFFFFDEMGMVFHELG